MATITNEAITYQPVFREYMRIHQLKPGDTWQTWEFLDWVSAMAERFKATATSVSSTTGALRKSQANHASSAACRRSCWKSVASVWTEIWSKRCSAWS